jgi:cytochrome oxidase assembly protein ShyY1
VLLKPRWLAGHALVIVMASLFVLAGFWQLHRNTEKHDKVQAAKAAFAAPAPLLTGNPDPASGARAQAAGTFLAGKDVILRDQSRDKNLGEEVLTPMQLPDGTIVLVDRGWLPGGITSTAPTITPAPAGNAIAHGLILESRQLKPQDSVKTVDGTLSVPRVDTQEIARRLGLERVRNVWLEAQSLDPAPGRDAPQLPTPPPPDQVNHMQYAIQWFAFALIPLIGWPIVLWQITRRRARPRESPPG